MLCFLLPELELLVLLLQEFLGSPPLLVPLLQQGLQAGGLLQPSPQGLHLLLQLTLLLLTAPLQERAGG